MVTVTKSVTIEKSVYVDVDVSVDVNLDDLTDAERRELLGVAAEGSTLNDLHAAFHRGPDAIVAVAVTIAPRPVLELPSVHQAHLFPGERHAARPQP